MADEIERSGASCQPPKDKDPFLEVNSEGIAAPSRTAEPLMETEGFVRDGAVQPATDAHADGSGAGADNATDPNADGRDKAMMYNNDEFNRAVPKQRKWPL